MDLNLLRVFEAVFHERNLTRAADTLALTPSAVSHALRRLRTHLGDPLFVRQGALMVPTPTCNRHAPALFDQLDRMRQLLQQWGQFEPASTRQSFRIGMPEAVEMMLMPALQARVLQQAPSATLASVAYDRTQLAHALTTGRLDLAIDVAMPMRPPIHHQPALHDDFCVVARHNHPLRRKPTLKQYLAASHVAVSSRLGGVVIEDAALLGQGLQRQLALRCQTYACAFAIVASSDHLLTVPTQLSQTAAAAMALQRWRTPVPLPQVHVHLYWHANNGSDPASQWLRGVVMQVAQERARVRA